jgi:hypothetical protein
MLLSSESLFFAPAVARSNPGWATVCSFHAITLHADVLDEMFRHKNSHVVIYFAIYQGLGLSRSRIHPFPSGSWLGLFSSLVIDEEEREEDDKSPNPIKTTRVLRAQYHLTNK